MSAEDLRYEMKEYLRNNLSIELVDYTYIIGEPAIKLYLKLDGSAISEDYILLNRIGE
jgi:hypothetical protein